MSRDLVFVISNAGTVLVSPVLAAPGVLTAAGNAPTIRPTAIATATTLLRARGGGALLLDIEKLLSFLSISAPHCGGCARSIGSGWCDGRLSIMIMRLTRVRHLGLTTRSTGAKELVLACERPAEGLQAGQRGHSGVSRGHSEHERPRLSIELAPGTPREVWCQGEMRGGQKNKLTCRWARTWSCGRRSGSGTHQRTESTYLFCCALIESFARRSGAGATPTACTSFGLAKTDRLIAEIKAELEGAAAQSRRTGKPARRSIRVARRQRILKRAATSRIGRADARSNAEMSGENTLQGTGTR